MKDWLLANWKPMASVAFLVAVWFFVRKFPLTPDEREDMQVILLISGVGAAALPGFRAARREDDAP